MKHVHFIGPISAQRAAVSDKKNRTTRVSYLTISALVTCWWRITAIPSESVKYIHCLTGLSSHQLFSSCSQQINNNVNTYLYSLFSTIFKCSYLH